MGVDYSLYKYLRRAGKGVRARDAQLKGGAKPGRCNSGFLNYKIGRWDDLAPNFVLFPITMKEL